MAKENISATVDPEVAAFVNRDEVNTSGLINNLLSQHMNGGSSEQHMLQFRIQQVKSEIDSLEGRLENKQEELEELNRRYENVTEENQRLLDKAEDALEPSDLRERNERVEYWAGELDMAVSELVERLE